MNSDDFCCAEHSTFRFDTRAGNLFLTSDAEKRLRQETSWFDDDLLDGLVSLWNNTAPKERQFHYISAAHSAVLLRHYPNPSDLEQRLRKLVAKMQEKQPRFVVAMMQQGYHWYLAVVDLHEKKSALLDSLGSDTNEKKFPFLSQLVSMLSIQQRGINIDWVIQRDSMNCGCYVLMFCLLILLGITDTAEIAVMVTKVNPLRFRRFLQLFVDGKVDWWDPCWMVPTFLKGEPDPQPWSGEKLLWDYAALKAEVQRHRKMEKGMYATTCR
jgi:hypothetical protein